MIWPVLPAAWLRSVSTGVPALARDIVEAVVDEIPEYQLARRGPLFSEAQRIASEALLTFVRWLSTPRPGPKTSPSIELTETFRSLGQMEALAGRSHDTLQSAYRIASRIVMRRLLEWEREFPIPADRIADFAAAVFAFIDELAELSAQGFADARGEGPNVARDRSRLIGQLLDPRGFVLDAVATRAERVEWALPQAATLIDVIDLPDAYDAAAFARLAQHLLGASALSGNALGRMLIVSSAPVNVERLGTRLRAVEHDAWLAVGFHVPLDELAESYRWVRRVGGLRDAGEVPDAPVITCDAYPLALVHDAGREVYRRLIERRLGPLTQLSLSKRVKYGRLLSAWLELGSTRGAAPGVLDKHRQTLRYQVARLEEMFGAQLIDREARLELMLALRAALPEWERELQPGGGSRQVEIVPGAQASLV